MGWGGGSQGAAGAARAAGLPFAGIPPEIADRVEEIKKTEPAFLETTIPFSHTSADLRPFTLRRFVAPHWVAMVLSSVLVGLEIATEQVGPLLTQRGIDHGIFKGNFSVLVACSIAYMSAILLNAGIRAVRVAWTGRVGEKLMYALRIRVFSHLQRLSIGFYNKEKAGRIMTRMTSDVEALQQLFQEGLVNLLVQGLTLVFVSTVLIAYNRNLALVVLLVIVPIMLAMTLWFRSASNKAFKAARERIADVLSDLAESLSGIRIVAMYNRQKHNSIKHRNVVGAHLDANLHAARVSGIYGSGVEGVGILGQILVLLVGARMLNAGTLTPGELTAFLLYLSAFFAPIQQLVQLYNTYQQGRAAANKVRELLLLQPEVKEAASALALPPLHGEIELEDVTFSYLPGMPVLKNTSLHIAAGEKFALVGPTGAGKSTIAKLISRFYDPDSGRVLIDGHDLRDVTLLSLRTQLGVVPQEPFLFAGSIRDNIAFARPTATDDEIMEACHLVGIEDLIEGLPQGLDTPAHERGATLSSGERQLIALARAFLAKPKVIILDEATSNLDLGTEAKIERGLDILLEGRTAVLIAHRLSTAMRADRIAVVGHSGIAEIGTHQELLDRNQNYAQLFRIWAKDDRSKLVATPK